MIDVENYVYTQVRNAIKAEYPSASVSGEYIENPARFPHVSLEMTDSSTDAASMTAQTREFAANQTFTANVYTNTQTAKTDAKALADIVDRVMQNLGFRRSQMLNTPNIDRTIYRLTLRFVGIVSLGYDGEESHYKITAR